MQQKQIKADFIPFNKMLKSRAGAPRLTIDYTYINPWNDKLNTVNNSSPNHNLASVISTIITIIVTRSEIILHFLCDFLILVFQSLFQCKST